MERLPAVYGCTTYLLADFCGNFINKNYHSKRSHYTPKLLSPALFGRCKGVPLGAGLVTLQHLATITTDLVVSFCRLRTDHRRCIVCPTSSGMSCRLTHNNVGNGDVHNFTITQTHQQRSVCVQLTLSVHHFSYRSKMSLPNCSRSYRSNPPFFNFWHLGALALRTNQPFFIFWHLGALALSPERESARMSKIKKCWVRPVWPWTLIGVTIWHHWALKG